MIQLLRPVPFRIAPEMAAALCEISGLKAIRLDDEPNTVVAWLDVPVKLPLLGTREVEVQAHTRIEVRGSLKIDVLHAKAKGIPVQIESRWLDRVPAVALLEEPRPLPWIRELSFVGR